MSLLRPPPSIRNDGRVVSRSSSPFRALSLVGLPALIGCGLNMRYVVEGDMRFEHCYRLDEDDRTPLDEKRRCWREWTVAYQKGQDNSRVAYASERLRALDGAATGASPPPSATVAAVATDSVPKPGTPYAPPPATAAGEVSLTGSVAITACGQSCAGTWHGCTLTCSGGTTCLSTCEDTYRGCLKGCL